MNKREIRARDGRAAVAVGNRIVESYGGLRARGGRYDKIAVCIDRDATLTNVRDSTDAQRIVVGITVVVEKCPG